MGSCCIVDELARTTTDAQVDVPLRRGGTITGGVTDADGNPVPGLELEAETSDPESCWARGTAITGDDGRYSIAGMPDEQLDVPPVAGDPGTSTGAVRIPVER